MNSSKENHSVISVPWQEYRVLWIFQNKELYGLDIPKMLKEKEGSKRPIKLVAVYRILWSLERKGLITARWGEIVVAERGGSRRRYYKLTDLGIESLDAPIVPSLRDRVTDWVRGLFFAGKNEGNKS